MNIFLRSGNRHRSFSDRCAVKLAVIICFGINQKQAGRIDSEIIFYILKLVLVQLPGYHARVAKLIFYIKFPKVDSVFSENKICGIYLVSSLGKIDDKTSLSPLHST